MNLSQEIQDKLNEQVWHETHASNHYLAMASWAEKNGFMGTAKFMYKSAEEEREHMLDFFKYLNENGAYAYVPAVEAPKYDYASLREVFEMVYKLEADNTEAISRLADFALEKRDHGTYKFMLKYVEEQQEEMQKAQRLLDLLRLCGDDLRGYFFIDKEVGNHA